MSGADERKRDVQLNIRVSSDEKKRFEAAAEAAGLDLSTWLRLLARKASGMKAGV